MSDLWITASRDAEAEDLERRLTAARLAATPVWPFLAAATSHRDFENRKALAADRIEHVAANAAGGDPVLFGVVHSSLLEGFTRDFTILHTARLEQREAAKVAGTDEAYSAWEALEEGTKIRVGFEGDVHEGVFTGTSHSADDVYGSQSLIVHYTVDGEPRQFMPTRGEKPRTAAKTAAEGQTCSVCGDAIAKDPSGEDNSTWHHDNGEKHDHEAKPASSDSKESSRTATKTWDEAFEEARAEGKDHGEAADYATSVAGPKKDEKAKESAKVAFTTPHEEYDAGVAKGAADAAAGLPPRVDLTTLTQNIYAPEGGGPNYWTQGYAFGYSGKHSMAAKTADTTQWYVARSAPETARGFEDVSGPYASEAEAEAAKPEGPGYTTYPRRSDEDQVSYERFMTSSRRTAGWPSVPSQMFPGETIPSCPRCGSTAIVNEVLPGYGGRIGDPGTESVRRCTDCGYRESEPARYSSRRTAGDNPFPPKKDEDSDDDKVVNEETPEEATSWACPACQATDAYTQGGKDLEAALEAKEPIKCGSCGNIDSSGGQAAEQAPAAPAQQPPVKPVASRKVAADEDGQTPMYVVLDESGSMLAMYPTEEAAEAGRKTFNGTTTVEQRSYRFGGRKQADTESGTSDDFHGGRPFGGRLTSEQIREITQRDPDANEYVQPTQADYDAFAEWIRTTYGPEAYRSYYSGGLSDFEGSRGRRPFVREATSRHLHCDACGNEWTTTAQYNLACPSCGAEESVRTAAKTAGNPYQPTENPYLNDPPTSPGMPDDQFDGPPDNPLNRIEPPTTTRPRQQPSGAPADHSVMQGFASKSTPDLVQER